MADLRDKHGNPIQLTDELGNPVQLTDQYGNPMNLIGVATTQTTTDQAQLQPGPEVHSATTMHEGDLAAPTVGYEGEHKELKEERQHEGGSGEIPCSSSSSSSSSEDDGQGGRKKKGLKEKIKEKLTGGKHKEEHSHVTSEAPTTTPKTTAD